MSVEDVMTVVRADCHYYENSGGGLTISGGEPTVQFDFCKALLTAAKTERIHTCLDTCGHCANERLLELLPWVDLFHFDWKLDTPEDQKRWTGMDNSLIRRNLESLIEQGARIILRCPIIPGVNDDPAHAERLADWEAHPGVESVERLPYHQIGLAKAHDLGQRVVPF